MLKPFIFESEPGFRWRIAHHIEVADHTAELLEIAENMSETQNLMPAARIAASEDIAQRRRHPQFAAARTIRTGGVLRGRIDAVREQAG